MAPSSDPRREVGAQVHAKAMLVKALAQCRRWFGPTNADTAFLNGIVQKVIVGRSNKRSKTQLKVEFFLTDDTKIVKELNVRSVKAGHAQVPPVFVEDSSDNENPVTIQKKVTVHGYKWVEQSRPISIGELTTSRPWLLVLEI